MVEEQSHQDSKNLRAEFDFIPHTLNIFNEAWYLHILNNNVI